MKKAILLSTAVWSAVTAAVAAEYAIDCYSGHSTHTVDEGKFTPTHARNNADAQNYLGWVNSSHCNAFFWAGMPTNYVTSAVIEWPVAQGGTINGANIDIWALGINSPLVELIYNQKVWWHTWDDTTPVRRDANDEYVYLIDGRLPVKVHDNAIQAGTAINRNETPIFTFNPTGLLTQVGLAFNRGAETSAYMLLRFNPDQLKETQGQIRFNGGSPENIAVANENAGSQQYTPSRVRYTAPDGVPAPVSHLTAAERASEWYCRSTVNWVQYRDSDGASGFEYPAYCGVKNGKTRDLYFTIDAPAYTLTNAWLTINALPPFAGSIPAGARVSLSFMGFAGDPAANQDFVVTNGMFDGQAPIVLQDNVLRNGLTFGQSLFTRRVGQRDLIRALNARVEALKNVWADNRRGQKAVFRLAVEAAGGADDWGFSIGSAATPGVEAFFEAIEYRKITVLRFPNADFESGLDNWTVNTKNYTENQISVVEDPCNPDNHCLRFKNVDDPIETFKISQWLNDDALAKKTQGCCYKISYRCYFPEKLERDDGETLTLYGFLTLYSKDETNRDLKVSDLRWADYYRAAKVWHTSVENKLFKPYQQYGLQLILTFECFRDCDRNEGHEAYIDDIELTFEEFYDYPKEEPSMMLIIR